MSETKQKIERIPYMVVFEEKSTRKDTYGGEVGYAFVECMLTRPMDAPSKTVVVFSHPVGGGSFLPVVGGLAKAGVHVLYVNTRYRGNDTALIMENCVVDLGAGIKDAMRRFGYERIILGGWSGGGSLALLYQEQAVRPTITETPAGDPLDLAAAGLVPADAFLIVAAHVSRAATLTEWIDPSVRDESRPFDRDPELNLYDPANSNRPPYSEEFVTAYRKEQVARNSRITAWVREQLDSLRAAGRENEERAFTVHGTMADPRFLDPSLEPSERKPGQCYLGDPAIVNDGPVGLARFCTLRSWLSQWSLEESRAHGERNAANTDIPSLVINNLADDACTPSHAERLHAALGTSDKTLYKIAGATHYYAGQPEQLAECVSTSRAWLEGRSLL